MDNWGDGRKQNTLIDRWCYLTVSCPDFVVTSVLRSYYNLAFNRPGTVQVPKRPYWELETPATGYKVLYWIRYTHSKQLFFYFLGELILCCMKTNHTNSIILWVTETENRGLLENLLCYYKHISWHTERFSHEGKKGKLNSVIVWYLQWIHVYRKYILYNYTGPK